MTSPVTARRPYLTVAVVAAVLCGLFLSLRQSEELTYARRHLPASCIAALADMEHTRARTRGVSLRDCASRRMQANRNARVIGRWVYGPAGHRVDGYLVWLREARSESVSFDRLMHVAIVENNAVLNEFNMTGAGCAGGIKTVNLEGNSFGLVINLTPEALVRFAATAQVEASYQPGDLLADPHYCVARLVMVDRRPVAVRLNSQPATANDTPVPATVTATAARRQRCLDDRIAARSASGGASLSFPEGYAGFLAEYIAACTGK